MIYEQLSPPATVLGEEGMLQSFSLSCHSGRWSIWEVEVESMVESHG